MKNGNWMKKGGIFLMTLLLALEGCTQSTKSSDMGYEKNAATSYARTESIAAAGLAEDGEVAEEFAMDGGDYENAAVIGETVPLAEMDVTGEPAEKESEESISRKIVWTGYLEIESTDYEQTRKEIQQMFDKYQVLVESSGEYDSGNRWSSSSYAYTQRTMNWQIRIPSDRFAAFFEETGSLTGQIRSKSTSSSDLTKQYSDTANRIESLTIQQNNLMEMMKKADTVEDMLAIEDRLTEVRSELRILTNRNSQIDYDVDYSSLSIQLQEVHIYETKNLTFTERLQQTILDSAAGFVQAMADLGVLLIYAFPYLVVFGALAVLILRFLRRRRERKGSRKEKTEVEKAEIEKAEIEKTEIEKTDKEKQAKE